MPFLEKLIANFQTRFDDFILGEQVLLYISNPFLERDVRGFSSEVRAFSYSHQIFSYIRAAALQMELIDLQENKNSFAARELREQENSRTDVKNYRPVSILPTLSKVLERVVFDQMEKYLTQKNLLYDLQSGFRSAYSTDTCLTHLCDYIRQESEKGNYTGMVLLDLQKAFDTVDHSILLNKLQCLGFGQASLQWFRSYLSNRNQICDYDGVCSEPMQISCGVPQGSILGPLLFLIYVNDMPAAVNCKVILYADDSSLLVSGRNISQIQDTLSDELSNISQWLLDNRLSLHVGKSECILFGTKHKIKKAPEFKVTCTVMVMKFKPQQRLHI